MTTEITFSVKSSAIRAAKRDNLVGHTIVQNEDGRWVIVVASTDVIRSPVAHVWEFLAANAAMSRKDQIAAMIDAGLNANMVKTQTSRFYVSGGDKKKWTLIERARKASKAMQDAANDFNYVGNKAHY